MAPRGGAGAQARHRRPTPAPCRAARAARTSRTPARPGTAAGTGQPGLAVAAMTAGARPAAPAARGQGSGPARSRSAESWRSPSTGRRVHRLPHWPLGPSSAPPPAVPRARPRRLYLASASPPWHHSGQPGPRRGGHDRGRTPRGPSRKGPSVGPRGRGRGAGCTGLTGATRCMLWACLSAYAEAQPRRFAPPQRIDARSIVGWQRPWARRQTQARRPRLKAR